MDWTFLGLIAGMFTTAGFVPQLIKGYRTKRMDDISLLMPAVLGGGMILWLIYGVVLKDPPIIIWNAIASVLNIGIVALKIRYSRRPSGMHGML
jgi:MtN3 and saliva related transmembrane protein